MIEDATYFKRPSPDALLRAVGESSRGRLKIFLGAAPGVGKTYEMLSAGHARKRDGVDVVVGVVETHGRQETEALLAGFEIVPRLRSVHNGHAIDEMDLGALLTRRPQLALVDELAHSNAPESKHPKRWQDVEELLAAGIDVYTTLNIQHVESLNDVVAQITRIRVRETVPDLILDRADDIELIDLTPDDLIRRLQEGKIYVPKTAASALGNYFSPGNLTALRELALRRTAQRVDDQLLKHMQAHAIAGPWAAGERVLVCVSDDPRSLGLVRYAKRLADRLRAPWIAVTVESPHSIGLSDPQRDRIAEALRLADRLGGDAVTIPGSGRIADDMIAYARENNVTQIVVGKTTRSRWFELLYGSVVHSLVRRAGAISVHLIAGEERAPAEKATGASRSLGGESPGFTAYAIALFVVASVVGLAKLVQPLLGAETVDLLLLTGIVVVAVQFGLYPSLLAVIAASLTYNFLFLPPLYTFTISDPANVASLILFGIVALLVSNLASRVRLQAAIARSRAKTTELLYGFTRKLTSCTGLDDVLWATAFQLASLLDARVVVLLPDNDGRLSVRAGYPPEDTLDRSDLAAANVAYDTAQPAGRGADTLPGARRLFLPMQSNRGVVGVVGLDADRPGPLLSPERSRLYVALSDQAALAVEQIGLLAALDRAKLDAETDRLRQALLTSISHDLRTPLAAIMGSAGTLRDFEDSLDPATKRDLLTSIQDESERLYRFIANLLDMTRLESGAIAPNLSPNEVSEIVGAALRRAAKVLSGHDLNVAVDPDLPMIAVDPVLFEQVLFNLLDNAAKYAPPYTTISILARRAPAGSAVEIQVQDEGNGIDVSELDRIFDKFHRSAKQDMVRAGTGLGLSVCKGFIEAMGGTIAAGNRTDRSGAAFTITVPASVPSAAAGVA